MNFSKLVTTKVVDGNEDLRTSVALRSWFALAAKLPALLATLMFFELQVTRNFEGTPVTVDKFQFVRAIGG